MEEKLAQHPSDLIKIVLFGPESTGKTTLSKQLAAHYQTEWVPEYARDYLQNKWNEVQEVCSYEDLLAIAIGQMQLENTLSKKANKLLVCDTDMLETMVYSYAYFNKADPLLEVFARKNSYDLYFLTDIDVPWIKDDLRDRPDRRGEMFNLFKTALVENQRSFVTLKGNQEERLATAVEHIEKLFQQ